MTTPTRLPRYEVHNDGAGPYVVFFCEACGQATRTAPDAISSTVQDLGEQAIGGLLQQVFGAATAKSVTQSDLLRPAVLTIPQVNLAWSAISQQFRQCSTCGKIVCLKDFDEQRGVCRAHLPTPRTEPAPAAQQSERPAQKKKPARSRRAATAETPAAQPEGNARRTTRRSAATTKPAPGAQPEAETHRTGRRSTATKPAPAAQPAAEARPTGRRSTAAPAATVKANVPILLRIFSHKSGKERLQIFFTTPEAHTNSGGLDEQLATAIDAAKESVDIAAFELDLPRVAEAMVRAHQRGVQVRLVTETDNLSQKAIKAIKKAGIPVVDDRREALMHDKFVVIDHKQVWTGSWNLTFSCTYRNNNNAVVVESAELAQNYTAEFNEMFEKRRFGADSTRATTSHARLRIGDILIENYFAPEDDVWSHILPVVEGAKASIRFLAFSFTTDALQAMLTKKRKAGLVVQGVMDERNVQASGNEFAALRQAGLDVLVDGNPYAMHDKVIIVDEAIVITGSFNFTNTAQRDNDENVLIIHSPKIARRYLAEFHKIYRQAQTTQRT